MGESFKSPPTPFADVPHPEGVFQGLATGTEVRGSDGHRTRGQQEVQVRLPPELLVGGRQSGSSSTFKVVPPPGFSIHWRTADEAGRHLRESQTNQ
ncbi:unnamed protein product [Nezara viridula]|uniref:Uncharacterized protein n=1 Tax=Nezara viridula TaxID=85310 RepID=A0A9P0DYI1_NEZVI|nr:unnamed protein product [Nezara viridula]